MRDVPCPTCRRTTPWEGNPSRPFCSERCRVLDLGAWATDRFRIAGDPVTDDVAPGSEDDQD